MLSFGLLISFVLGAAIGSFLNVVTFRLKSGKKMGLARSECMSCKKKLSFIDLIPLVSFVFLRGKCRHCSSKISPQYLIVELVTAIAFSIVYVSTFYSSGIMSGTSFVNLLIYWVYVSFLIVIFVYDLKHYLILDKVLVPAFIVALVGSFFLGYQEMHFHILGSFIFGFTLLFLYHVSHGTWIGGGDVKLAFVLGLMVGFPNVIVTFMLAFVLGALISLVLMIFCKKTLKSQVPFGTFLTSATFLSFFVAAPMIEWYMQMIYLY
ncbi:prepilin peptidase [Patescibacteria group bacterium]|nr:prepilin peptidase [Patescibacteria group bacterium]